MRVTGTGHASLHVQTTAGTVLCDPWVRPAYFGSWYPFPDNSALDWDAFGDVDYLYVSHLHRDHFDPETLRRHVRKSATVLLPAFPTTELRDALTSLGFTSFLETRSDVPVDLDGLRVQITALTTPTDGPMGDSALALADGTGSLFNQNDARPVDVDAVTGFTDRFDAHLLQFSGAIWWPLVYDLPPAAMAAFGRDKRARGLDRAARFVGAVGARAVLPNAGPPCFLDESLAAYNDVDGDEANTFPDQTVFLARLAELGYDTGRLWLPGSVAEIAHGEVTVSQPGTEVTRALSDKAAYLAEFAAREQVTLRAEHESWGAPDLDVLAELRQWWEPLLDAAPLLRTGVGFVLMLELTTPGADAPEQIVVDFPAGTVRPPEPEDRPRHWLRVDRRLIESLIATHETDWVNSLLLSMRFQAKRIGAYNEYVYTFFKSLTAERIGLVEAWLAADTDDGASVDLDGWRVQARCPHLQADLGRFGVVADGVLTCQMHGWTFDLASGRCLTAPGHPIRAEHLEPATVD